MRPLLFDLISTRQRWLGQREAVLGQNVANADTPDYRPLDLKPASFRELELLGRRLGPTLAVQLARTQPLHAAGAPPRAVEARARRVKGFETAPSGNAVVLDEQMQKLAQTQLDYELTTNLYRR